MTQDPQAVAFFGVPEFWQRALTLAFARASPCVPEVTSFYGQLERFVAVHANATVVCCSASRTLPARLRRLVADRGIRVVVIQDEGRRVAVFAPGGSRRLRGLGIHDLAALIANAPEPPRDA